MVDIPRNENAGLGVDGLALSDFLLEVARQAIGEPLQVLYQGGPARPGLKRESFESSNAEFLEAVERQLVDGPVLAIPSWEQDRGPLGPVAGQQFVELVQLYDGPLGLLVPISSLSNPDRSDRFREALLGHKRSLLVVEAYEALTNVHPSFLASLVVLHPEVAGDRPLARFVRVPHHPDVAAVIDDVRRLLRMPGGQRQHGFVHLGDLDPYSPLTYQHYDPVLRGRKAELRTWGKGTTLGALFEIRVSHVSRSGNEPSVPGLGRFVTGRSIGPDGRLVITQSDDPPKIAALPLMAGDLVTREIFQPTDPGGLRVAEVREDDLPISAAQNVLVLRPKRPLSEAERLLLRHYLRSHLAKDLAVAAGAKLRLTPSILSQLYVPLAEEPLLAAVRSIAEANRLLSQWSDDAIRALDSIFDLESPTEARLALIERGRESRLRVDAASQIDDFDYRVRTLYPYPVAYRWRSLNSVASMGGSGETLREIRHGFEHILAYCGCLALAVARHEGLEIPELRRFGAIDGYKTFLTTWTDVLEQVGKKVRGRLTSNPLLVHLGTLQDSEDVAEAVARLSAYRREESHTLTTAGEEQLVEQLMSDVRTLVHGLRFLADYELVEIVETQWDLISRRNTVRYRAFVGDHPIVPVRTITVGQAEIEKDSLYIREKDSKEFLAVLRPYLLGRRCGDCRNWGTFYLHEVHGVTAKIKSVELGHANEVTELAATLRAVAAG